MVCPYLGFQGGNGDINSLIFGCNKLLGYGIILVWHVAYGCMMPVKIFRVVAVFAIVGVFVIPWFIIGTSYRGENVISPGTGGILRHEPIRRRSVSEPILVRSDTPNLSVSASEMAEAYAMSGEMATRAALRHGFAIGWGWSNTRESALKNAHVYKNRHIVDRGVFFDAKRNRWSAVILYERGVCVKCFVQILGISHYVLYDPGTLRSGS